MKRPTLRTWLLRLALAASSFSACNAITGANDLSVGDAAGEAQGGGGGGDAKGSGGRGGNRSGRGGGGGGGGEAGPGGGSGGAGVGTTCNVTDTTAEDCRSCCGKQRPGLDAPLDSKYLEAIDACLCEPASDENLSTSCKGCREGICGGFSSGDEGYAGACESCLRESSSCPALNGICNQLTNVCRTLVTCYHGCQRLD